MEAAVATHTDELGAVFREFHTVNVISLLWEDSDLKQLKHSVCCHNWVDCVVRGGKVFLFGAGVDIPESHRPVATRGDECTAVWRKRHVPNFVGVTFESCPESTGMDMP